MLPSANFCSNCGKALRKLPPATSVSRQILVYLVSFFLAPLGLWYAWKYLKQDNRKSKIIGVVAIALTLAAIALALWTASGLYDLVSRYLDSSYDLGF
jgi:TRAP-type C4-dicarboxylate transport system permease small subunit